MVGDVVVCELRFSDVLTAHIGSVVYSAQFSADGRQILSASDNNTVRIWSAVTGECEQTMMGHTDGVTSVAFSPDGRLIVSGGFDSAMRVWDAATVE